MNPKPSPSLLAALQHDAVGDWHKAHELCQIEDTPASAHVHAYLHRKEGDETNARYWYSRAKVPFCHDELETEWSNLVRKLS